MKFHPAEQVSHRRIITALRFLAFLGFISQASLALSVDCVPHGISLSTQVAVDDFQEIHGPCDHIVDYLSISGDQINNTDGLVALASIGGDLGFFEATALADVALPYLLGVGGNLQVFGANKLSQFDLGNLGSVGGYLDIYGVHVLTKMDLSSLTFVGGDFYLANSAALSDIDSLSSLIHVGGNVYVSGNSQLRECRGLLRLLDDVDDGLEGPGNELTEVPDVAGWVSLGANLSGCNSINQVMTIFSNGFEARFNTITQLDKNVGVTGRANSIAVSEDGMPVIAYVQTDFYTDITSLKVAKCSDIKCTGAQISVVDTGDDSVSIAIGQDGLPVISYISYDKGLKVAKCNDPACSGADETISVVDNTRRDSTALAIGLDGYPVISYVSDAGFISVVNCNDNGCSGGDEVINSTGQSGNGPSMAIPSDGNPIIAYREMIDPWQGYTKVVKCNDPACAGNDETVSLINHTGAWIGTSLSIAIGADDLPVIIYGNTVTDYVVVTKCNDSACSGGDEIHSNLEATYDLQNPSLAIGADGFPLVGYIDSHELGGQMKIAKCTEHSCSQHVSRAIVDDEHAYRFSSIAVGQDGLPIVSYFDLFARSLKVAHCESASCR